MAYEEKLEKLNEDEFFQFFSQMKAEPRWVNSAGHRSIQILGLCHCGQSHSALFDPNTLKVSCFSLCGGGFLFHTWVKKVIKVDNPQEAKDFIEDWIDDRGIDFQNRISRNIDDFEYKERPFEVEDVPVVEPIPKEIIDELYSNLDCSEKTLKRLVWHTKDGISTEMLRKMQIGYDPIRKTIILPHHNINGDIVGLYQRSFLPLRRQIKQDNPEMSYKDLCRFPRAKYVPLLKDPKYIKEESDKTSWSFSNIHNLYGLHLAKDEIARTGKAIIFEGAKSVMLAHDYGYPFCVASHTFGANTNHISMLIKAGAKEIIFAFDKQYEKVDEEDRQWLLYEKKTRELAEKIGKFVDVSRLIDFDENGLLDYKDAPIDKGKEVFEKLYNNREPLIVNGESQSERKRLKSKSDIQNVLDRIKVKKIEHEDPIEEGEEIPIYL